MAARMVVLSSLVLFYLCSVSLCAKRLQRRQSETAAPKVMIQRIDAPQEIGSDFEITCLASGNPQPTIYWTGAAGGTLPSCVVDLNGVLLFRNFQEDCDGQFQCHAMNVIGNDVDSIYIFAIEPPSQDPGEDCQFLCSDANATCVTREARCNGTEECPNGLDELLGCEITETQCRPDELACEDGSCHLLLHKCDGIADCLDGSDEQGCPPSSGQCLSSQFHCSSSKVPCIPKAGRCNGIVECENGEDEHECVKPIARFGPVNGPIDRIIGSTIKLKCEARGTPPPFITWKYNCGPLPKSSRFSLVSVNGKGSLTITNATTGDSGHYSCDMISIYGREQVHRETQLIVQDPEEFQCEDADGVPFKSSVRYYLRKSTETSKGVSEAADIVFVVDETGSMVEEHRWLRMVVYKLDSALKLVGIGNGSVSNRFALVGFARDTDRDRGGTVIRDLTAPANFVSGVMDLKLDGVFEDGYSGILTALNGVSFRKNTTKHIVLITDEDRDVLKFFLKKSTIINKLREGNFTLSVVVQQSFQAIHGGVNDDRTVLGVDSTMQAYAFDPDKPTGFSILDKAVKDEGFRNTYEDYVELAFSLRSSAWDLRKIREGEPVISAFTNAFVKVNVEEILSFKQACFECICIPPEQQCIQVVTSLHRCKGEVNPEPKLPNVCVSPLEVFAIYNSSLTFRCNIQTPSGSDPVVRVIWTRPPGAARGTQIGKSLRLNRLTETSIGNYTCNVHTTAGQVAIGTAEILTPLFVVPSVDIVPKTVAVEINDTVTLGCKVKGIPEPYVTWQRGDGKPLVKSSKIEYDSENKVWQLAMRYISAEQLGVYVCMAENVVGRSQLFVVVTEKSK